MRVLIEDTETTGLFDYSKRADEDGQPRMAELAAMLVDTDALQGLHIDDPLPLSVIRCFIKPDGWEMPAELVTKLGHGLTTEFLTEHGVPVRDALEKWVALHNDADVIAGFNVDYDLKVLRGELRRANMPDLFGEKEKFCVMRASGKLCQLRNVKNGYRNPKLSEAVEILLRRQHVDQHRAWADCQAATSLFWHLQRRGLGPSTPSPVPADPADVPAFLA